MNIQEFIRSTSEDRPPSLVNPLLHALWHDAKGNWTKSHEIAQEIESREGSWVHAYLHRKEGDKGNAQYWYDKARKPFCNASLQKEWEDICAELLLGEEALNEKTPPV